MGEKCALWTPVGEICVWRDYKGVRLHGQATLAEFQDNAALIDWVLCSTTGITSYLYRRRS